MPTLHSMTPKSPSRRAVAAFAAALPLAAGACAPKVVVGDRYCAEPPSEGGATPDLDADVGSSWSTGFESGFCDYAQPLGFCFTTGAASFVRVTSPVHSGQYAAAFTADSSVDGGSQVRCVVQGVFATAAYYGAWYYVPGPATNSGNWNLLHFQGADSSANGLMNLWDVSLVSLGDGGLQLALYDYPAQALSNASAAPPIPIGRWFHVEVYFHRAGDGTGELTLWQDGERAVHLTGVETDPTAWGQWYVGNLATALRPAASTVYIDDVTIESSM